MTDALPPGTRRRRSIIAGGLAVLAAAVSFFMPQSGTLVFSRRILLVAGVLIGGARLFGTVRRALRAQREGPLEADSRSPDRGNVVPAELHRIMSEVAKGRENQPQFAGSLAPRLARLAERRAWLSARPAAPWDLRAPQGGPGSGKPRGPSLREMDGMIRRIKEL